MSPTDGPIGEPYCQAIQLPEPQRSFFMSEKKLTFLTSETTFVAIIVDCFCDAERVQKSHGRGQPASNSTERGRG